MSMIYDVPGVGIIEIDTLVVDSNGTISVKGEIVPGVVERIHKIQAMGVNVVMISSDQRGNARALAQSSGITYYEAANGREKEDVLISLGSNNVAAIGNARTDIGLFVKSVISIATLQGEGIHKDIIDHVDVIMPSINDALDFFLDSNTFIATMKR
ncbi:HAD family hydrolase [Ancylomarina sp. YFZ004]